jgi:uncharacterized membrane protein YgcG
MNFVFVTVGIFIALLAISGLYLIYPDWIERRERKKKAEESATRMKARVDFLNRSSNDLQKPLFNIENSLPSFDLYQENRSSFPFKNINVVETKHSIESGGGHFGGGGATSSWDAVTDDASSVADSVTSSFD